MNDPALEAALGSSQRLGMLGERPIPEVIDHATAFVTALGDVTGCVVDLGSGGGVPGLVIARARSDLRLVLVDRRATRMDHVARLVRRLDLDDRVQVIASDVANLELDEPAAAAVARGFGPPDVTLTLAARVVRSGGLIVISEPPMPEPNRWSSELLAQACVDRTDSPDPRVAVFQRH